MGNKYYKSSNKAKIVKQGLFKREDNNQSIICETQAKESEKQFLDRELKKLEVQAKKSIR